MSARLSEVILSRSFRVLTAALLMCALSFSNDEAAQEAGEKAQVDSLIYDLKNPDPVRRKDAAVSLGNIRARRAAPALVESAGDPDSAVRREVVAALDKMVDARSLSAFIRLSADGEEEIREKCIHAIVNLYLPQDTGLVPALSRVANFFNPWSDESADLIIDRGVAVDPSGIAAIRGRLRDPKEGIRVKACRALGILRAQDAVDALLESLRDDRSNSVRFESVRALRKIADHSAAKSLVSFVSYPDARVRNEAVYTLGRLRHRAAVAHLTRLFEKESALPAKSVDKVYRERLLDALAFIADASSHDLFVKQRLDPEENLRLHAVEGLARIGNPTLVTELSRERLQEKGPKLQIALAFALYRMGRPEYLDELVRGLGNRRTNNEARQYLVEFRPEEVPELYKHVRIDDVAVREGLAEVLGLIGDSRAVPALQELGKDERGQIAALANQGIRRINLRLATD